MMPNISLLAVITVLSIASLYVVKAELPDRKSLKHFHTTNQNQLPDVTIHKVSLTQKGYIQFLKYMTDVPTIEDFTFCIWLRSTNLSESHPLLSYSKHEEERLIRGWIGSQGQLINLEILAHEIFAVPVNLKENKWYHICESWESHSGTWSLFLNGRFKAGGVNVKMRGIKIPSGGDVVVGQEYTDFDKGLDDGIEGDIFGFNLVLATASSSEKQSSNYIKQNDLAQRRQLTAPTAHTLKTPINIHNPERQRYEGYFDYQTTATTTRPNLKEESSSVDAKETDVPEVLSYFTTNVNRNPKGLLDIGRSFLNMFDFFEPETNVRVRTVDEFNRDQDNRYHNMYHNIRPMQNRHPVRIITPNKRVFNANSRILNEPGFNYKPLGFVLMELSYQNCALGRGSPINDKRVLISWTKTPVRVFGGAILKTVPPFCVKTIKDFNYN